MPVNARLPIRLLALAAALVLALALPACGSDDDEGSAGGGAGQEEQGGDRGEGPYGGGGDDSDDGGSGDGDGSGDGSGEGSDGDDEEQARAAVEELYDAFAEADAGRVCGAMAEAAREQVTRSGQGRSCEQIFGRFLSSAEESGGLERTLKAEVAGVRLSGDRGTATVRFGKQSGQVPVVKEDGEWRVGIATPAPPPPGSGE